MSLNKNRLVLSNGLCVLNARKMTNDLVMLAITNFNDTRRVIFDTVDNKVLRLPAELKLSKADMDLILPYAKNYIKQPEAEKVVAVVEV